MARFNPEVTVEVDWDGDGTYGHALSDVSADASFNSTHGTQVQSLWSRPVFRSARGSLTLPVETYLPGKAGGISKDDARRRNAIRVRSTAGSTTTTLLEGFTSIPRVSDRVVRWDVEGKLDRLLGEEGTVVQPVFGAETTDQATVDLWGALLGVAAGDLDPPPVDGVSLALFTEADQPVGRLFSLYCQVAGAIPVETATGSPVLGPRQPSSEPSHDADIASSTHRVTSLESVDDTGQVRNRILAQVQALERTTHTSASNSFSWSRPGSSFLAPVFAFPTAELPDATQMRTDSWTLSQPAPGAGFAYINYRVEFGAPGLRQLTAQYRSPGANNSTTTLLHDRDSGLADLALHVEAEEQADGTVDIEVYATKSGPGPGEWDFGSFGGIGTQDVWYVDGVNDGIWYVAVPFTARYDRISTLQPVVTGDSLDVEVVNQASIDRDEAITERLPNLWLPEATGAADLQAVVDVTAEPPTLHTVEIPLAQETEAKSTEIAELDAGQVIGFGAVDDAIEVGQVCAIASVGTSIRPGSPPTRQLVLLELGHSWTPPAPPTPPVPPGPFGLASWSPPTGQVADVLALITAGSRAEPYRQSNGTGVIGAGSDLELEGISPAETINRVRITDSPQGNVRIRLNGTGSGDFGNGFNTGGTYEDGAVVVQTEDGSAVFSNPSEQQSEGASFLVMESSDADDNAIMDAITAGTKMLLAITRPS